MNKSLLASFILCAALAIGPAVAQQPTPSAAPTSGASTSAPDATPADESPSAAPSPVSTPSAPLQTPSKPTPPVKSVTKPAPRAAVHVIMPVVGRNLTHVVRPGEDLYTLGLQYKLAIEHFMWANRHDDVEVAVGRKLIVPTMRIPPALLEEGLVINLPERGVYLFKNHEVAAFYPCAIGMGGRFATPIGDCKIANRQVDPTWDPPEWSGLKDVVPPGPNNPLGDRWIGLTMDGVGLHGTTQPMSIGQAASHGCMRMYPHVIRELFERVRVGMTVKVMYEPIKVGISPEDRKVYVQVFPDVYGLIADPMAVLKAKLEKAGLSDLVDESRLKSLLANKNGLPTAALGDDIVIKVNDRKITTVLAPFMKDGQIWATSDVLAAVGARAVYNAADKKMVVTRDDQMVEFQVGSKMEGGADFTARVWNGKSVLPIKPVLSSLNLVYKWVPKHKTLLIYCTDLNATL
jgi:L,D-transpeptidase ErfK/SrfK